MINDGLLLAEGFLLKQDESDEFVDVTNKHEKINLSGVVLKASDKGLFILSQPPIYNAANYLKGIKLLTELIHRVTKFDVWFNHVCLQVRSLDELGYKIQSLQYLLKEMPQLETYTNKIQTLENVTNIDIKDNLSRGISRAITELYILIKKRFDTTNKTKKLNELKLSIQKVLDEFKGWCGDLSDTQILQNDQPSKLLRKFEGLMTFHSSLESEVESIAHIACKIITDKLKNDIVVWINKHLILINNNHINYRLSELNSSYDSLKWPPPPPPKDNLDDWDPEKKELLAESLKRNLSTNGNLDEADPDSEEILLKIQSQQAKTEELLTSLKSLIVSFPMKGIVQLEAQIENDELMSQIDIGLSKATLLNRKVKWIYDSSKGYLAFPA